MKHKIKALLAASNILAVSLILALLILPSPGADRANFVFAGSFPTETTCITDVGLLDDSDLIAVFTGDGQTKYAEVGQKIDRFDAIVRIDPDYAGSENEAITNTRVYGTVSHPTAGTVFAGYLTNVGATWWSEMYIVSFSEDFSEHTLVAGTYTVTTLYQIYA